MLPIVYGLNRLKWYPSSLITLSFCINLISLRHIVCPGEISAFYTVIIITRTHKHFNFIFMSLSHQCCQVRSSCPLLKIVLRRWYQRTFDIGYIVQGKRRFWTRTHDTTHSYFVFEEKCCMMQKGRFVKQQKSTVYMFSLYFLVCKRQSPETSVY